MIKVIVFDVDDTLLDFTACSRIALQTACQKTGVDYSQKLYDTFQEMNDSFWARIEAGTLTLSQLWKIRWNTIFAALGIQADGARFETIFHGCLDETHEIMDHADQILPALTEKYLLFAASNGRQKQQEHRLSLASLAPYLTAVFTSEAARVNKPDPDFFRQLYELIRCWEPTVEKGEILMVGDSLRSDIRGAADFGFQTWYTKEKPLAGLLNLNS